MGMLHLPDDRGALRRLLGRHPVASAFGALVLLVAVVVGLAWQRAASAQRADPDFVARVERPAYVTEHPRVLIDAAHHDFHTATGNYRPFADLLRRDGYEVAGNRAAFSDATLSGYRVLVVANALGAKGVLAMLADLVGIHSALGWDLQAFAPAECDAVRDWVAAGGSLLLIADHAPMGKAAQALARRFGVEMSNCFTEDDTHCVPDHYSWLVFARADGTLRAHPVTDGRDSAERVDTVVTFTGQSLKGPAGSVPFLSLTDNARDYPTRRSTLREGRSAAGRAQGIALQFGKGRVVVLGEAAMLTAQVFRLPGQEVRLGMEYPGSGDRQLALNIMHWLSGLTN